jgi:Tol biopolymer transport system component
MVAAGRERLVLGQQVYPVERVHLRQRVLLDGGCGGGTKKQLTLRTGENTLSDAFAKNGKGFYATTDKGNEFQRLTYFDTATMTPAYLTTDIKWDVDSFVLSEDGRQIAFLTNEAGISKLYMLDTASRKYRPLTVPVGVIGGLRWHANGRDLGTICISQSPGCLSST